MYNILLTDDEQIVLDSLSFIIEKNFPEQTHIIKASSGSDAINLCRTNKIDLIFMDINMPLLNGLDAVSEIKRFNPKTVVVILSAFDSFQYAQQAVALGVFRYLTKPVNRNIVVQTVRNAFDLIDVEAEKYSGELEFRQNLNFVTSVMESDFIYSSVYSSDDNNELERYLDYFKIASGDYYFICIELSFSKTENRSEKYLKVRDLIQSCALCITGPLMANSILVFVPCNQIVEDDQGRQLEDIARQETVRNIFSKLTINVDRKMKVSVSKIYSSLKDSKKAYDDCLSLLERLSEGEYGFYDTYDGSENTFLDDGSDVDKTEQVIIGRIKAGDVQGVRNQATKYVVRLFENRKNIDQIRNDSFNLLILARGIVSEVKKDYDKNPVFRTTFSTLNQCEVEEDFIRFLSDSLSDCAFAIQNAYAGKKNPVIQRCLEFVENNLSQDLSLDETAAYLKLNPFYLSRLFKDETGLNFTDYVTMQRLQKASELLRNSMLSIKEISAACGYSDQNYFSRIFKKQFDLTPSEYRNSVVRG